MKNTTITTQPTLALRRHSIRTLTPSELRIVAGGGAGAKSSSCDSNRA